MIPKRDWGETSDGFANPMHAEVSEKILSEKAGS
jgi:hypothetical protein